MENSIENTEALNETATAVIDTPEVEEVLAELPFLVTDPDAPILRTVGRRVTNDNFAEAQECVLKMEQVLAERPSHGVAAQQVGHDLQMFYIVHKGEPILCINPRLQLIKPTKYTIRFNEGCLSIPDKLFAVRRCNVVKLKYKDKHGKNQEKRFKDFSAAIVQHEYDHIKGVLISDKGKELTGTDKLMALSNSGTL